MYYAVRQGKAKYEMVGVIIKPLNFICQFSDPLHNSLKFSLKCWNILFTVYHTVYPEYTVVKICKLLLKWCPYALQDFT